MGLSPICNFQGLKHKIGTKLICFWQIIENQQLTSEQYLTEMNRDTIHTTYTPCSSKVLYDSYFDSIKNKYTVGAQVLGLKKGSWVRGEIIQVRDDGSYDIKYIDNETECFVDKYNLLFRTGINNTLNMSEPRGESMFIIGSQQDPIMTKLSEKMLSSSYN